MRVVSAVGEDQEQLPFLQRVAERLETLIEVVGRDLLILLGLRGWRGKFLIDQLGRDAVEAELDPSARVQHHSNSVAVADQRLVDKVIGMVVNHELLPACLRGVGSGLIDQNFGRIEGERGADRLCYD